MTESGRQGERQGEARNLALIAARSVCMYLDAVAFAASNRKHLHPHAPTLQEERTARQAARTTTSDGAILFRGQWIRVEGEEEGDRASKTWRMSRKEPEQHAGIGWGQVGGGTP